ncbi:MAG: nodulation protein NfeD [Kiritimatiellae bacterium]|nr:nodulation protein NfeD [Kiritimatiellia bacterium]
MTKSPMVLTRFAFITGLIAASSLLVLPAAARETVVARIDGIIGPVTARFMIQTVEQAENQVAECVVFELDTPGGLDDSMRLIIKKIMASKVPVVVYVAPSGSRAASAGAFITMAAHIAAMAPGTAIGAAHPVTLGPTSGTIDTNMTAKAENDAAAFIRSIAEKRGRNIEWANSAVKDSVSLSETEALQKKVIDLIAPSLPALLDAIDGRTVTLGTNKVQLVTKGVSVINTSMNWRDELLATIANPNVAYVLFMLGLLGLYFELSNPGAILPGVVGAISLILAFFAFQTLSVNVAGILLILLAIVLFIVDVKAATHGVLTVGGVIAMFIGSIMLFDSPDPALRVSMQVVIPVVLVTTIFFMIGVWLSIRSLARRPVSGEAGLIGQEGDARTAINAKSGQVFVSGTHWNAVASAPITEGTRIKVIQVKGMTLKVEVI